MAPLYFLKKKMNYQTYKNEATSEKITLAIMHASKRLVSWTLETGAIYKKSQSGIVQGASVNGVALTEAASSALNSGEFYHDRTTSEIFIRLSDDSSPVGKFVVVVRKLFFASSAVSLPYDLASGEEVFFEPMVDSTSAFGVEIDTVNQQTEAIEGDGVLTLRNDQEFWPAYFDKLTFENQTVEIYSWATALDASEAKLLFRGKVESKSYSQHQIVFKLKDLMANLRDAVPLQAISTLNARHPANLATAFQRMIFGRLNGFRPVNIDALQNGSYPITGTVTVSNGSATVTGASTAFLSELSPDDRLMIAGVEYTIANVDTNTSLTLTETYSVPGASGLSVEVKPANSKRWINRVWKIAGHPLCQPTRTVQAGSSTSRLFLDSTRDIFDGDKIYVGDLGSGELVTVDKVINSTQLSLSESLAVNHSLGTSVIRPAIQKLKINDTELLFWRDFTLNADLARLTLRSSAEWNAAQTRESTQSATMTNGSRVVTGTGTSFKTLLKPGMIVRIKGTVDFFEVLSVESDTQFTLRTDASGLTPSPKTGQLQYRELILDPGSDVLSCEVLGRTHDNTTTGQLLKTAPEIVQTLLTDAGLQSQINTVSFDNAKELSQEELAFSIPKKMDEKKTTTYRDVINEINKSVFGILLQDGNFQFSYDLLRPQAGTAASLTLDESDCLSFKAVGTNKNVIQKATVNYGRREYDDETSEESTQVVSRTSDHVTYMLGSGKQRTFESLLVNEADAQRLADRWGFLLENSTQSIQIETKLQAIDLAINDVIIFQHKKLYERFSGSAKAKILLVERLEKTASGVSIAAVDLSNAFNRVCFISDVETSYENTEETDRMSAGFYCDAEGLSGDERSHGTNLIW